MSRVVGLLLVMLAALCCAPAHAAEEFASRDAAWAACQAKATQLTADALPSNPSAPYQCILKFEGTGGTTGQYCVATKTGTALCSFSYNWYALCPGGKRWNPTDNTCAPSEDECKDRPPLGNVFTVGFGGSGSTCSNGCRYAPPVSTCTVVNGGKVCSVSGGKPTGEVCSAADPPPTPEKPQECLPAGGGLTFCLKPDGRHCHTASNGRQVCWDPGETGEKPDVDVKQKRDPGTDPQTPSPGPNNDPLNPVGPPVQTQTQVKDGNGVRDINTVVQNWQTSNGTNAGSGNEGENGDGSGGDEGEEDDNTPGQVGEGVGQLYEGDDRGVSDVFNQFRQRVMAAPIANAGTQFLTVSVGNACPVWSVPATDWYDTLVFDFHCNGALADALVLCGYLLLAVAAYQAFKWGFL